MLDDLFGETGGAIAQFILALIVVLILILIVAWLLKKLGGGRFGATNSGQAELSIVDTLAIDPKRRLVLVRHGKLEHLLLIGGGSDEVVERSIVGGLPITARMQANKAPPPAPEKPAEPVARPSSKFLDRLERTNAARKSSAASSEGGNPAPAGGDKTSSNDLAALGANAAAAAALGTSAAASTTTGAQSAYATMVAATSKAESKSAPGTQAEKPDDTEKPDDKAPANEESDAKAAPAAILLPQTPISAPEPIDLPALPQLSKPSSATELAGKPTPPTSTSSAVAPPAVAPPTGVSMASTDRPLPKSEREALEQSLDAALHDSLLAPEPANVPETTSATTVSQAATETDEMTVGHEDPASLPHAPEASSADDMDFNLFDDGELEREMEAALAGTSASPAPSPELDAQSTAAIEAELAIDMEAPSKSSPVFLPVPNPSTEALETVPAAETADKIEGKSSETDDELPPADPEMVTPVLAEEAPKDTLPPYKDIPVELSRPDTVAVQIPSRGPAANATSVTKADNGISNEGAGTLPEGPSSPVDLSQLLETQPSGDQTAPESSGTEPASNQGSDQGSNKETTKGSGKSADLDEEMRRLLGEIAGAPKPN